MITTTVRISGRVFLAFAVLVLLSLAQEGMMGDAYATPGTPRNVTPSTAPPPTSPPVTTPEDASQAPSTTKAPEPPPGKPYKRRPQEAAAWAWAHRLQLCPCRIRVLQQRKVNANTVDVLLLATLPDNPERVPTALVRVNKTQWGWRVP